MKELPGKKFLDEDKKEYSVFDDFFFKILYYLSLDNTDTVVEQPWYSTIETVDYLIEVQSRGVIVSNYNLTFDKYIYRDFYNQKEGEIIEL
jgi:hypothetical protein